MIRAALYMGHWWPPALTRRYGIYQRLLAAGKPKKLALTACLRKLLPVLNSMAMTGRS